jgi:hypothetical protein
MQALAKHASIQRRTCGISAQGACASAASAHPVQPLHLCHQLLVLLPEAHHLSLALRQLPAELCLTGGGLGLGLLQGLPD